MKTKRVVLGITGGIATGKSTVMNLLAQQGIPGISSDTLSHSAIRKGTPAYRAILKRFGRRVLRSYGHISRTKLGRLVFGDAQERRWLEKQIHPYVIRELKRFKSRSPGLIALDIPLLFEAQLQKLVDVVVVVDAPRAAQLRRLLKRDQLSRPEALRRIRAQMPLSKKRDQADWVISNGGTQAQLKVEVQQLVQKLNFLTSQSRRV